MDQKLFNDERLTPSDGLFSGIIRQALARVRTRRRRSGATTRASSSRQAGRRTREA